MSVTIPRCSQCKRTFTEVAGLPAVNKIPLLKSYDTMEANALEKEILKKWKEIVLSR